MTGRLLKWQFLVATLAVLLSSCTYRDLKVVESTMETDPAVADSLLNDVSVPSRGRSLALYALLRTQIDYKMYRTVESDSIIRIATDYYGTRHKSYHGALAWYSKGCINEELGQELSALDDYMRAVRLFPDATVRYLAMCYQNAGAIYVRHMMFNDAERTLNACLAHPSCKLHSRMYYSCKFNLGLSALYAENLIQADSIFSSIISDTLSPSYYYRQSRFQKYKIQIENNDNLDSVITNINTLVQLSPTDNTTGVFYSLLADIYNKRNEPDSAYHYYILSDSLSNDIYTLCTNALNLTYLSSSFGKNQESVYWLDRYIALKDDIQEIENSNTIVELQYKYRQELEKNDFNHRKWRFFAICLFATILLCLLLLLQYQHKRRVADRINLAEKERLIELENDLRNSSVELLEQEVRQISDNNTKAKTVILELVKCRLMTCMKKFEHTKEWQLLFESQNKSEKGLSEFEKQSILKAVEVNFFETMSDVIREVPSVSREEIITALLLKMNCTYDTVSDLFNLSSDAIRKRKSRLQNKLPEELKFILLFADK
ncbi:MAG: hypothetical protein MJY96_03720 [Bacteroidaceae bacterium]|nr:hypothetical protein [Bacteroidaceae bacterium]